MELPDGPMYIVSKNDIEKLFIKMAIQKLLSLLFLNHLPILQTISSSQPYILGYQKITYADAKSKSHYYV